MGSPVPSPRSAEPPWRCERKFHGAGRSLAEVELALRTHPAHFHVVHPPRFVNNIYFDTPDLARFRTHIDGAAERMKLRVRWYGAARGPVTAPVLERKARCGDVGSKLRVELAPFRYEPGFDAEAVVGDALARRPCSSIATCAATTSRRTHASARPSTRSSTTRPWSAAGRPRGAPSRSASSW